MVSDSVRPQRRQPTRLPRPWDSPGKNTGVGCHFLLQCMKVKSESKVAQSCLTLSHPMDCSPPGSSIHGIFQARVLEWGAIALPNYNSPQTSSGPLLALSIKSYWNTYTLIHLCIICECFQAITAALSSCNRGLLAQNIYHLILCRQFCQSLILYE